MTENCRLAPTLQAVACRFIFLGTGADTDPLNSLSRLQRLSGKNKERINFLAEIQKDITASQRSNLYTNLFEVALEFGLDEYTQFLACSLCDRYMTKVLVTQAEAQVLAAACLSLAAKYKQGIILSMDAVGDLCGLSVEEMTTAELAVLRALDWQVDDAVSLEYFPILSSVTGLRDAAQESSVYESFKTVCHIMLMEYKFFAFSASEVACGAYLASFILYNSEKTINDVLPIVCDKLYLSIDKMRMLLNQFADIFSSLSDKNKTRADTASPVDIIDVAH